MSLGADDIRLETVELAAVADLFSAAPPVHAGALGVSSLEIGGAFCGAVTALPGARTFNRVAGLGVESVVEDRHLDAIAAFYASLRLGYVVSLAPVEHADALDRRLTARGYVPDYAWVKFARPVSPVPETETRLRVEAVGADRAHDFGTVVAAGFGLPPAVGAWCAALAGRQGWTCFVAYEGDEPAGAGAVFMDGGAGWLGLGATMPEHRRKGAQGAILAARIAAAADAGCDVVVTETGAVEEGRPSNSYRNIERSGFVATYTRPNLRNPEGG
jgi:hypothetical protein